MKSFFKLKGLKSYLIASLAAALLVSAGAGVAWYAFQPNPPAKLWAVDDTTWVPVVRNSDAAGPTRENPVWIEAQVERLYGWHIGTPIHVRYKIVALSSVKMRFETLKKGILSRYKTTWRVVEPPQLVSEVKKEGYKTRIIDLVVAVWEPPSLPESVPLAAPTNFMPPPASSQRQPDPVVTAASPETAATSDAAAPNSDTTATDGAPVEARLWPFSVEFVVSTDEKNEPWRYIETPAINFGFASLLEPDADQHGLDFGPMTDAPDHPNRVGVALVNAGYVVSAGGVLYLGVIFFRWLRRRKLPRLLPEEVVRYRLSIEAAERSKNMRSHFEQVRIAVRDFLGGASLPDNDLIARWSDTPRGEKVAQALDILTKAVSAGRLNTFEELRVAEAMNSLIEDRLKLDAPAKSRWSRLGAAIKAKATGFSRFVKPIGKIVKLPSLLRARLKRRSK
jgi:hypothetical protein